MTYVYDFDDRSGTGRELLGGKGAGLAEMTQIGVPVPAGFTITTDACRAYMAEGKRLPAGLEDEVAEHVERLEERTRQAARRPRRSPAPLGPLRRRRLDAGDDGLDPQPRAQRRGDRGACEDDSQRALRIRLVPPPDPDVRRGRRRHRRAPLRAAADRPQACEGRQAGRRARRRRPARARRRVQVDLRGGDGQPVPAGRARPADARGPRRLRVVGQPARAGVPPRARHPRRPRHRRERHADGLREQGRDVGDRRQLHARPGDGRAGPLRRVPAERAGRGRGRGHPHAAQARADAGRRFPRRSRSSSTRWPRSSGTTATCRTSSSRSRRASSSSSRRAARSAPPRPLSKRPSRWWRRD